MPTGYFVEMGFGNRLQRGRTPVILGLSLVALVISVPFALLFLHYFSGERAIASGSRATATVLEIIDGRDADAWSCGLRRNLAARVEFDLDGERILTDVAVDAADPPRVGDGIVIQYASDDPDLSLVRTCVLQ